jgi:hypothetical protein
MNDTSQIRQIKSFLHKIKNDEKLEPTYDKIIILSDSKGNYLKNQVENISQYADTSSVVFWSRGGRKSSEGVSFLEEKISHGCPLLGNNSVVLFWHSTCDVTNLQRPQRYVRPAFESGDEFLNYLEPSFRKLVDINNQNSFDIGFLETPPVFPSIWNKSKGDPDWGCFEDSFINNQIDKVNNHIRTINQELNYVSPKFVCDCMKFRKRGKTRKTFLCSDLFQDGIHPVDCAAQKWLYQIIKSVSRGLVW